MTKPPAPSDNPTYMDTRGPAENRDANPTTCHDADPAMRHDVRNLLAPAMIALDRLSMHADQAVRAEAERGIAAIEAAVLRLKRRL